MPRFRDIPISQKVLVIVLVTTAAALALSGTAIVVVDSLLFRSAMERDLSALSRIVADNSTAALSFDDPRVAAETLAALRARPHMRAACIYTETGDLFARYPQSGAASECPKPQGADGVRIERGEFVSSRAIMLEQHRLGTLMLRYDMGEARDRMMLYGQTVLAILLASSLFALLLSSRLRSLIVTPVARLARAAAAVSQTGDYGLRVQKDSADELGVLVDAFNQMLARIQSRDEEVKSARNLLQTTLTSIGDAVLSADVNGRVVFANPVACTLLRREERDIVGRELEDVFRIGGEPGALVGGVLHTGSAAPIVQQATLAAGDGAEIPIELSVSAMRQDGHAIGVVLVFRDIGERLRAHRDTAYLAAIVESSEDAILGQSADGTIQTWNPGAERLYGYKAEEMIGHSVRELIPEDRRHEESSILEQLREGRVVHFETLRQRKDGSQVDVSLIVSPMRDRSGRITGASHIARDITAQKKYAEEMRQTQKLESLGVLAGGIAHDFNNLLTGILGNASLAIEELPAFSAARQPLAAAIQASERAAQLARQMLAYSGKGHFVLERVDLSARVRDIVPLLKAAVPPTVQIQLELGNDLPGIEADPAQLQQLIMNIIINGAEAVPDGHPGTVTVRTRQQELANPTPAFGGAVGPSTELKPGTYVAFEVADTGLGMDEQTKARIFDPFFTTKFTGRGLGLAAVLGIVRGHHGSIDISSELGKGTTFRVLFPAVAAASEQESRSDAPDVADLRGSGTILVVDDEPVVRRMAVQALERFGYTVLAAEDGARGLEVFQREAATIRCVLLDLTMPVMSGEETLAQMKRLRPEVPVILSSGFNEAQAVRKFQGRMLAGFLQKPYKAAELLSKVRNVLALARSAH
jgi:PAS domain S-box-containing protein